MSGNSAALVLCSFLIVCQVVSGWQNPEMASQADQLILEDIFEWYKLEPKALKLTYDATKLSGKLTLNLLGYSERNSTKISKVQTPFTMLATVDIPDAANGELDALKLGLKCLNKPDDCNKYDMGYVQIAMGKTENETHGSSLGSPIIPLGWFVNPNYVSEGFATWPYGKCQTWHKSEPAELRAAMKTVNCPNTMSVAMSDPGWYLRSNYLAGFPSGEKRSGNSTAEPAQTCFYSSIEDVPANLHAAPASLCCYRNSDSVLLQKEFMTPDNPRLHGSSVLRSHPYGSDYHHEHYLPGQVPYLSHFYWDMLPYLYCCHWWKGSACAQFYLGLRPAPMIKRKPSGSKAAFVHGSNIYPIGGGQPAFCSDVGEYWLVRSSAIQVQMRNYVVSSYTGKLPANWPHRADFKVSASKSAFVTAVAVRSQQTKDIVVELVCPEGEFRSYIQVTDTKTQTTVSYDGSMGLGLGTKIVVGDTSQNGSNKVYSILAKYAASRVGIFGYVVQPGEELMNLYLTVSADLIANITGLAVGGSCIDNKIDNWDDRIFSSICDNCEDFLKYKVGRPLYYEKMEDPTKLSATPGISCQGDTVCQYFAWSTNNLPYYQAVAESKTSHIDRLLPKLDYTGWDVCQNPNITGLFVSQDQSLNESSTIQLKCVKPYTSSAEGSTATCAKSGESMAFGIPEGFLCAETKEVIVAQEKAKAADVEYTKKHYTPEAATAASGRRSPQTVLLGVALALAGLLRGLTLAM